MRPKKRHNGLLFLFLFIFFSALGTYTLAQSSQHVIDQQYIGVRRTADAQTPLAALVASSETIHVIEQQGDWTHIAYRDTQHGWVPTSLLQKSVTERDFATPVFITVANTPTFQEPEAQSPAQEALPLNSKYLRYYEANGWSQLVIDGQLRWMSTSHTRLSTDNTMHPDAKTTNLESATVVTVKKSGTTVRLGTTDTSDVLYNTTENEELYYLGTAANGYYNVQTLSGIVGFALANELTAPVDKIQRVGAGAIRLSEATVVIDAGHGGSDPGAVYEDVYEKEVALKTALILKQKLEALGTTVIMTREGDDTTKLEKIVEISNNANADVFISLHYDATEDDQLSSGTTTYFYHYADATLATLVNNQLRDQLPLANRGIHFKDLKVTRENTQPALLLELGYMDNPQDVAIFNTDSYREKVADSIVKGLEHYFKLIQ